MNGSNGWGLLLAEELFRQPALSDHLRQSSRRYVVLHGVRRNRDELHIAADQAAPDLMAAAMMAELGKAVPGDDGDELDKGEI